MTAQRALYTTAIDHHLAINAPAVSHYSSGPVVTYSPLAEGDGGTFQTLDAMVACVLGHVPPDYSGYQDEFNIRAAYQIVSSTSGLNSGEASHDGREQIAALFNWVTANITYEPHPLNQQTLQDAKRTIELRKGDCVSLSVLLATLAMCLGIKPRFIAQWVDGESASHVYVEVLLDDGQWLALDAVAKEQPIGWRQPTLDGGFEVAWPVFD